MKICKRASSRRPTTKLSSQKHYLSQPWRTRLLDIHNCNANTNSRYDTEKSRDIIPQQTTGGADDETTGTPKGNTKEEEEVRRLLDIHDGNANTNSRYDAEKSRDRPQKDTCMKINDAADRPDDDEATNRGDTGKSSSKASTALAICLCFVGSMFYCASFVSVQYLGGAVPENELNSWRFVAGALLAAPFAARSQGSISIARSQWHFLLLSTFFSVIANTTLYTAAIYLPLGTVSALDTGTAIVIVVLVTVCVKKELTPKMYIGAVISVFGITFLLFPATEQRHTNWTSPCKHLQNASHETSPNQKYVASVVSAETLGYLLALACGINSSASQLIMKHYVAEGSPFALVFWRSLLAAVVSLLLMFLLGELTLPADLLCILSLVGHCVALSMHSIILPFCLQYLSASSANLFRAVNIVILVVLQYTLMKDVLPPKENWMEVLGAVFCLLGSAGGSFYEIIKTFYEEKKDVTNTQNKK